VARAAVNCNDRLSVCRQSHHRASVKQLNIISIEYPLLMGKTIHRDVEIVLKHQTNHVTHSPTAVHLRNSKRQDPSETGVTLEAGSIAGASIGGEIL
jgi:hypothetical protein